MTNKDTVEESPANAERDNIPIELPPEDHEPLSRRQVIGLVEQGIGHTLRKIENGRVRDADKEEVRVDRMKVLVKLAREHRLATKDMDLDELSDDVQELEAELIE